MREDPIKVERYRVWLNQQVPGSDWTPLVGFNAITTCSYTITGQLIFNPSVGTPTKAFLNKVTGEIRNFDARYFYAQ
jgi:hypothetical protein